MVTSYTINIPTVSMGLAFYCSARRAVACLKASSTVAALLCSRLRCCWRTGAGREGKGSRAIGGGRSAGKTRLFGWRVSRADRRVLPLRAHQYGRTPVDRSLAPYAAPYLGHDICMGIYFLFLFSLFLRNTLIHRFVAVAAKLLQASVR